MFNALALVEYIANAKDAAACTHWMEHCVRDPPQLFRNFVGIGLQSFKDRGFSLAVSYAKELGVRRGFTYSSGNGTLRPGPAPAVP